MSINIEVLDIDEDLKVTEEQKERFFHRYFPECSCSIPVSYNTKSQKRQYFYGGITL